jgi:hypothetical protein
MGMLHDVELLRVEKNHNYGVFGVLRIQKEAFCVTLEPPDFGNARGISCIPADQYLCGWVKSPAFGDTIEVRHVPDRSHILFHAGNRVKDTKGCILLAASFGKLHGDRAVLNSGATFQAFLKTMKDVGEFRLTIREVY